MFSSIFLVVISYISARRGEEDLPELLKRVKSPLFPGASLLHNPHHEAGVRLVSPVDPDDVVVQDHPCPVPLVSGVFGLLPKIEEILGYGR